MCDPLIEEDERRFVNTDGPSKTRCAAMTVPMVECMTRDAEKKEYYKGFLEDFKHLEKDHAEEIKAIRAARKN